MLCPPDRIPSSFWQLQLSPNVMSLSSPLPDVLLNSRTNDGVKYGKELLKEFLIDDQYRNLNHGSFGTYPRAVRDAMRSFQDQSEARPDEFIRYTYPRLLDKSREGIAKIVNAPVAEIVFVPNATTGVNTMLRSIPYEAGDYILYFSPIYGACEKTIAFLSETTPVKSTRVEFTFPVEDDWVVDAFKSRVQEVAASGGRVKVALFDTVVSMPGVCFPYKQLTQACKELGVLSCIDGAHGVGNIELDLRALDADFFTSNCHKWFHVPRGCAILHVPNRNQHLIRSTLPTSHGFIPLTGNIASPLPPSDEPRSAFENNFQFVGTIDNSPYLCIPEAIRWRERLGGEKAIRQYCHTLAQHGSRRIAQILGTKIMDNSSGSLTQCTMVNVLLPIDLGAIKASAVKAGIEPGTVGLEVRNWLAQTMVKEHATFIQTLFAEGQWWARLSGQVYLDMDDFEWAGKVLEQVSERANKGDWAKAKSVT
ncbi:unnamed protein product [Periconia digitata]|uniref:Aminotransferase class V domain-containing protein n=1 Tax=Periconia digitata TaxID=1303443 RepID=A0A9W4XQS7_9PLEO|nr:unnamed protein product [Periconia digitata]